MTCFLESLLSWLLLAEFLWVMILLLFIFHVHSQSFDEPSKLKGFLHVATFLFTEPMKFQVKGLKPEEPMMIINN